MNKKKEDCSWCISTQHIKRKISTYTPKEYEYRCSACLESFWEEHYVCDQCDRVLSTFKVRMSENDTGLYCQECLDR